MNILEAVITMKLLKKRVSERQSEEKKIDTKSNDKNIN